MSWAIVTVSGNLGADPKLKTFDEKGTMVCNLILYVTPRKSDPEHPPMKFQAEVWGKQAETCMNYLKKGSKPTITGTLDEETFTGKDGNLVTLKIIRFAQVVDLGPRNVSHDIAEEPQRADSRS